VPAVPPSGVLPDGIPVGLYRSTPDGRILDVNDTMVEMLGFPGREALLATDAGSLYVKPHDRARLKEQVERLQVVRAYEVELRRADGRHIWVELNVRVLAEAGVAPVWEGALNDVTERRLAEEALWESERRLRLMAEQMPAVLWSIDSELRFTLSLGAGLAALDLRPNEVVGTTLQDFLGGADPDAPMMAAHRRALAGESVSFRTEWAGRCYEAHVEPYRDAESRITGVLGIALDVTERRHAEEELQRMLAMLQSTLDSTADGILVLDRDGHITTFNRRFGELWRLTPEVLASRDNDTVLAAALEQVAEPDAFLDRVRRLRTQPGVVDRSLVRLRDGRVLERSVLPQRLEGRTVGHVLSFREVDPGP
jgi:PAS domain S-box-containing protein